jgi:hypothetical protein
VVLVSIDLALYFYLLVASWLFSQAASQQLAWVLYNLLFLLLPCSPFLLVEWLLL